MEKMYLTNNKLVVVPKDTSTQATHSASTSLKPSLSIGVTLVTIVSVGLLAYSMYQRSRVGGEV